MFGDNVSKNRRLTVKELEDEIQEAAIWRRPVRSYIKDKPYYPYCKPEPLVNQPLINFSLNFKF